MTRETAFFNTVDLKSNTNPEPFWICFNCQNRKDKDKKPKYNWIKMSLPYVQSSIRATKMPSMKILLKLCKD